MKELSDARERIRALTDLEATLLVEAAAGTGKTSLLAGRVVMLLGSGVGPREIAAITFTEFAAGELRERVTRFLTELLRGSVPEELCLAFADGITPPQRAALETARERLDELTCSTIHRFCHDLLRIYAVEAGIDPGADIFDEVQGDLAFASIFERWLRKRLDDITAKGDPIAHVAASDPIGAEKLLRALAEFRRQHRTAQPLPGDLDRGADIRFADCVAEFRRWINGVNAPPQVLEDVHDLDVLAAHFRGQFDPLPGFNELWRLAHPPRVGIMRARVFELQRYQRRGVWRRAAGPAEGARLADEAALHYERCADAFRELVGRLATAIVSIFSAELDALSRTFETFKRDAAVLDFDDLLYTTRQVLRQHTEVRRAAADRFRRILVDEFQDTDPIQSEIVFRLASSDEGSGPWHEHRLFPGRLFMVGDPKQAIYRFRGADVATYRQAREAVERQFPGNVIRVTANFRSCAEILRHVDLCFQQPLGAQEAGYVGLVPTRGDPAHGLPCVAKIKVEVMPQTRVDNIRDEEARIVAEACARLIGNLSIRRGGQTGVLAAGDIALLAPTSTELWRYERALEEAGLPFSSQAGKNLYRRQEAQDLVALVRALADVRDTVALGALLRGPLVGLTEQELLDETGNLPKDAAAGPPWLSLRTDPLSVKHPVLREVLAILRQLRSRAQSTTPALLLAEAVERLGIRAILMARSSDQASRAIANVDAILERARAYGVRGFRQFAQQLNAEWSRHASHLEGVVDAEGQSIAIVTIHSSKGLEWPVVIPINTASGSRPLQQFIHRRADDTLHWVLGDIVPPSLVAAIRSEATEASEERLRLLYVACTRAMDLLVLPELSWADDATWARALDFNLPKVPELDISRFAVRPIAPSPDAANGQDAAVFAAEQAKVREAFEPIRWIRPSDGDPDILPLDREAVAWAATVEATPQMAGSSMRGIILHKLMEELLNGEVAPSVAALEQRCAILIPQLLAIEEKAPRLDVKELAATAWRTFSLPDLARDREELVAEVPVYGSLAGDGHRLVSGRADAVRYSDGRARIVFDWKSDVSPEAATRAAYANQLAQYVHVLGAERGAVVYMTTGQIDWINASGR